MRVLLALLVTCFLAGRATAAPSKSGETEITTVIWQNDWTYLVNGKKAKGYNARAVFFYCPKPIYPFLARKAWATGKGVFRIQVGKDGVVTVEASQGLELESEVVEGFTFDRGFVSQFFITDVSRQEAVYEKPAIVITDKKIS